MQTCSATSGAEKSGADRVSACVAGCWRWACFRRRACACLASSSCLSRAKKNKGGKDAAGAEGAGDAGGAGGAESAAGGMAVVTSKSRVQSATIEGMPPSSQVQTAPIEEMAPSSPQSPLEEGGSILLPPLESPKATTTEVGLCRLNQVDP
jgi:hypothetical protein